jgi:site-specific DNA recombinase
LPREGSAVPTVQVDLRGALYHLLRNRIYGGEVVHKGVAYPGEHQPIVDEELWNAVQARLSDNLTERRQARIASGALLAIFDDRGHRMSPTYTVRRRNRYRYYISQAQLRGGEPGSRPRIGADEVEQLVVQALCRQRGRDDQMADGASGAWSADIRELVRTAIDRIVIRHDAIEIAFKSNAIDHAGRFVDGDTQNRAQRLSGLRFLLPGRAHANRQSFLAILKRGHVESIMS